MRDLRRFFNSWQNILGLVLIAVFATLALAAAWISPMSQKDPGIFQRLGRALDYEPQPPNEKALLGTLPGQYDVFHALVWGTGEAFRFGLAVAVVTALVGVLLGTLAGYAGGFINGVIMRITDAFLAFPAIAGVVFIQQLIGMSITAIGGMYMLNNQYFGNVVDIPTPLTGIQALLQKSDPLLISLILFSWMPFCRLVNTLILTLKRTDFVQAAQALGASPFWIIRRHLIPHAIAPVIVIAARDVGGAVILQATFTFIGISGNSTWGSILVMGRDWVIGPGGNIFTYWWVFIPATLAVILFGVAWNLLGDAINEISLPLSATIAKEVESSISGSPAAVNAASMKFFDQVENPGILNKPAMQPALPAQPIVPSLTRARAALQQEKIQEAVATYRALLHQDYRIEKIILDLNRAVGRYPLEAALWETLGEAYNQAGQLQQALDAYSKAIECFNRIKNT